MQKVSQDLSVIPCTNESNKYGKIELIQGPMFAGKTTELIQRVEEEQRAGRNCVVFKYQFDTRYSESMISTHDHRMIPAVPCKELAAHDAEASRAQVIAIDEGQFFPDLLEE
ncbi:MAG: thymidine kinase, partial [Streblomastix strix]